MMSLRAGLDLFEIFRSKGAIEGKVIIKALFQGRADRQLGSRENFFDGLSHDVRAAVTIDLRAFGGSRMCSGSIVSIFRARRCRRGRPVCRLLSPQDTSCRKPYGRGVGHGTTGWDPSLELRLLTADLVQR